jgi:hypothetical protein
MFLSRRVWAKHTDVCDVTLTFNGPNHNLRLIESGFLALRALWS